MGLNKFVEPKQYFLTFGVNICSSYTTIQPTFHFQRPSRLSMLILLFFPPTCSPLLLRKQVEHHILESKSGEKPPKLCPHSFPPPGLCSSYTCVHPQVPAWPILFMTLDFLISWLQFPLLKLSSMRPIEKERNDLGIDPSRSQSASQLSGGKRWQGYLVSNKLKKHLENSQFLPWSHALRFLTV